MNWLKEHWMLFVAALIAGLALWRAAIQENAARKWQETAVDIEKGNVVKGVETAEAASAQAQLHQNKAKEIKANGEKKVQKRNQSTADILAGWGVRDDADA